MSSATAQSKSVTGTVEAADPPESDFGGLYYLGSFASAKDLMLHSGICGAFGLMGSPPVLLSEVSGKASRSRCEVVVDRVAGSQEFGPEDTISWPYKIATDSKNRVIVVDRDRYPSIHIFDFAGRKHSRIAGNPGERLQAPSGLAIDGHDQWYVTDAQLGAILVYGPNGKFLRSIGTRRGQRLFARPGGIAVDSASGHIYVADPLQNVVVMLDADGNLLAKLGTKAGGSSPGEFAAPTDVVVRGHELFVLDSRNSRIQVFDLAGNFRASIHPESMGPSLGFSVDSRGRIYLDGPLNTVQVFQRDGRLFLQFGYAGTGDGQLQEPTGIWTDRLDRIYVADTGNHRVQSFEWGVKHGSKLPHPEEQSGPR
jgi:DNA-binding beta-propeller fold protein YncE